MTEPTTHRTDLPPRNRALWTMGLSAVILFGLAVRVFHAWTMQYMRNEDHCLVGLMAKHMAEGRDFPVFFYGQPYMGSLEPAVSAVLVWLFGPTGFMVYLGTALIGALMLPLLYVYGRDADSRWAGLLAMVYAMVGTESVLYFYVVPRGGYMTMMACGIPVVWLASRIATMTHARQRVSPWTYAALGLLAGLGWWSNQLVIVFIITACVVLLMAFRPSMIAVGLLPALAGFLLGAMPWLLWNITHRWGSFDFAGTFGKVTLNQGLRSFWEQFLVLAGFVPIHAWWSKTRAALFLCVLAAYVGIIVWDRLKKKDDGRFYYRVALPILVTVMVLLYARSHYARFVGAYRYLLPMVPAFAVMVGVVCARVLKSKSGPVGVLLLAAILPAYTVDFHKAWQTMLRERATVERVRKFADILAPQCDGVAFGDWVQFHWMNFASAEKLCVAVLPNERYAPYAKRAELAERPAILGDFKRFRTFLAATRGSSTQGNVEGFTFDCDIQPPPDNWRYVDSDQIESAADNKGSLITSALTDLCLDSGWVEQVGKHTNVTVTFTFRKPLPLCGVRFLSPTERYPTYLTLQGQIKNRTEWQTLVPHQRATCFFWSGNEVKVDGLQYFQELRFPAMAGGVKRLSIAFDVGEQELPYTFDLAEIRFLQEASSASEEELPTVESCIAALRSQGTSHLYAPRWLAGRVWMAAQGAFETTVPDNLKRTVNDQKTRDSTVPEPVVIQGNTSFVCDRRDAEVTRQVLKSRGLAWQEIELGRYVLMTASGADENLQANRLPAMYWTELGCFKMENGQLAKENAHWHYQKITDRKEKATPEETIRELKEVLRQYPGHQPARKALVAELENAGRRAEAEKNAAELRDQTEPGIPAPMRFADGVEFLGMSLSSTNVQRGAEFTIKYYWKCPPAALEKKLPQVFVHFVKGQELFQDDHTVLGHAERKEILYQPFDEILTETRQVRIPASSSPGEYVIRMGRKSAVWRMAVDTKLPQSRRAAEIPVSVAVNP